MVVVLGDQLDLESSALDGFDPASDVVWMAEVAGEATHVWSHKARIALFLAAMRHFRDHLRHRGFRVHYQSLDDQNNSGTFGGELARSISALKPERLILTRPGEWRVKREIESVAKQSDTPIDFRPDRHFLCSTEQFEDHARGRRQLRLEFFYREMRRTHNVLIEQGQPAGGAWNFDPANRGSFGRQGPPEVIPPRSFTPDAITREALALVEARFPNHPGSLQNFDWPVTANQARQALDDFITHRLDRFGEFQDAMWDGGLTPLPYLFHSRLSAALNLKLLDPRHVIAASEQAYRRDRAPLPSVEGFIRQILGWREYVRGVYWHFMPDYLDRNALNAAEPLPDFYWTGETEMHCLRCALAQTLQYGYAHHIQRLMVTGLFALLLGVKPQSVHEWYLAVYVDAVEWVELPNTLGMSQFADGGVMASKPYVASGKYIDRMSNYCAGCRYDPAQALGPQACPFTTLYWDFLMRHEKLLGGNQRMTMQLRNLKRLSSTRRSEIYKKAHQFREARHS